MSDPAFSRNSINTYTVYNENYNHLPVKIRLKGVNDPAPITVGPGQQVDLQIKYEGAVAKFYYTNAVVQMIDLNDGAKSDDLAAPNCDNNSYNTLRWYEGNPQGGLDVVNFDACTYKTTFGDQDGIDGGPRAVMLQSLTSNAIKLSIRRA